MGLRLIRAFDGLLFSADSWTPSWPGNLANPFDLLPDLTRPIRSDPAITCHFLIDPAIDSNFIDPVQLSNLIFDLFGIHSNFPILYSGFRHKIRWAIDKPLTEANDPAVAREIQTPAPIICSSLVPVLDCRGNQ